MRQSRGLAEEQKINSFSGSENWFMKWQSLSMSTKTSTAQKMAADYIEKILGFHKFVINAWKETCFELEPKGNMDKVPITFDVPSNNRLELFLWGHSTEMEVDLMPMHLLCHQIRYINHHDCFLFLNILWMPADNL